MAWVKFQPVRAGPRTGEALLIIGAGAKGKASVTKALAERLGITPDARRFDLLVDPERPAVFALDFHPAGELRASISSKTINLPTVALAVRGIVGTVETRLRLAPTMREGRPQVEFDLSAFVKAPEDLRTEAERRSPEERFILGHPPEPEPVAPVAGIPVTEPAAPAPTATSESREEKIVRLFRRLGGVSKVPAYWGAADRPKAEEIRRVLRERGIAVADPIPPAERGKKPAPEPVQAPASLDEPTPAPLPYRPDHDRSGAGLKEHQLREFVAPQIVTDKEPGGMRLTAPELVATVVGVCRDGLTPAEITKQYGGRLGTVTGDELRDWCRKHQKAIDPLSNEGKREYLCQLLLLLKGEKDPMAGSVAA